MKKIIVLTVLIISSFSIFSDEFAVKVSYVPNAASVFVTTIKDLNSFKDFETSMAFDVALSFRKDFFNLIYLSGKIDTFMFPSNYNIDKRISFQPFYSYYKVSGGIFYKNFTLDFTHQCTHPTDANLWVYQEPILNLNTSYDEISLEWKVKF
jgi:hypothetical protein